MEYLYGLLSGLGFIIILNNYMVFNIKNSLGDYSIISDTGKNQLLWNIFKFYSTTKHKTTRLLTSAINYIRVSKLQKNLLFIQNGVRSNNIAIEDGDIIDDIVNNSKEKHNELIFFRNPSTNNNNGYDLIRISNSATGESGSSIEDKINNYSCYNGKIHSPIVKIENDDTEYDLLSKDDNYYVIGNIIFDTPFIKWILKEQHDVSLSDSTKYTVSYFDEDMCEMDLSNNEALIIEADAIKKISIDDTTKNNSDESEENKPTKTDNQGWLW